MKVTFIILVCLFFINIQTSQATYGVDVSSPVSSSTFTCMRNAGYSFAIVRAYQSTGSPDPNVVATVRNAHAAGVPYVDVYMFPCPRCGKSAAAQVSEAITYLRSNSVSFGMFWFDIEGSQYWSSQSFNQNWFTQAVNQARSMGVTIGVYTSASQWAPIMGNFNGGSAYPLWYAHYDGVPGFGDFQPFAGWQHPAIKQFSDQGAKCSASYDINWYPS